MKGFVQYFANPTGIAREELLTVPVEFEVLNGKECILHFNPPAPIKDADGVNHMLPMLKIHLTQFNIDSISFFFEGYASVNKKFHIESFRVYLVDPRKDKEPQKKTTYTKEDKKADDKQWLELATKG
jgi:hypothetical protein